MRISSHLQGGPRQKELAESVAGRMRGRYQVELPDSEKSKTLFWGGEAEESPFTKVAFW